MPVGNRYLSVLDRIPFHQEMIPRGDERATPYLSDTLVQGEPDLIYRARDIKDLSEILHYCDRNSIPVTVCGSQTSLTGASVAKGGLLVVMTGRDRLLEIGVDPRGFPFATAEAGILLGDLQRAVAREGYFYPPDPTSRNEAQLGGTLGTNATGEDSLLYGPTRKYVRRLKFLSARGEEKVLQRTKPYTGPCKNQGGYCLTGDPVDLLVGSEGTLGIITEVTVDLLRAPPPCLVGWAFFPDLSAALNFVVTSRRSSSIKPRALELFDAEALKIVARQERAPAAASQSVCGVIFKEEYRSDAEAERQMGEWLALIERILGAKRDPSLLESVVMALDSPTQEHFRTLRHVVPSFLNEEARPFQAQGGGKVSTDWWVPIDKLVPMMGEVVAESDALGVRYVVYGHIGDGHPHINYLARDAEEKRRVEELLLRQCRRAVNDGGGVAGEHGIGKLHHACLEIQWPRAVIRKMLEIKRQYDPHRILGKGNLFPD